MHFDVVGVSNALVRFQKIKMRKYLKKSSVCTRWHYAVNLEQYLATHKVTKNLIAHSSYTVEKLVTQFVNGQ